MTGEDLARAHDSASICGVLCLGGKFWLGCSGSDDLIRRFSFGGSGSEALVRKVCRFHP